MNNHLARLADFILFRLYDADRLLARARREGKRRFVFAWIRGLGDVAFILNEFTRYVLKEVPGATVSALVRPGLEEACRWIQGIDRVITVDEWRREMILDSLWGYAFPTPREIRRALRSRGLEKDFDLILPYPLGRWYDRDPEKRSPFLRWTEKEARYGAKRIREAFPGESGFVITVNTSIGTDRFYPFDKEWGTANFSLLIRKILDSIPESRIILVDAVREGKIEEDRRLLDLRGGLTVSQSISVIAASDLFLCLDGGAVNLLYFLKDIDLSVIVLLGRISCFTPLRYPPASGNLRLMPVFGQDEDIHRITVEAVREALGAAHSEWLERKGYLTEK